MLPSNIMATSWYDLPPPSHFAHADTLASSADTVPVSMSALAFAAFEPSESLRDRQARSGLQGLERPFDQGAMSTLLEYMSNATSEHLPPETGEMADFFGLSKVLEMRT